MAGKVSPTLKVLMEIRDDARRFKASVESRFDGLDSRVDGLESRLTSLEGAVVGELVANRAAIEEMTRALRGWRDRYETRLDDHEERLRALEHRTG